MNKITVVACLLLSALTGAAQTYTFESNYSHWTASQGTLALSTDHYKEGTHSLEWTTQGKAQMIVSGSLPTPPTPTVASCRFTCRRQQAMN